tara:strand:- start:1284 stop:1628 length:345 start_codon:yes stop_codon:yes gene_type:complete
MQKDIAFIEMLRKILRYNHATGAIYWMPRDLNTFKTDEIGCAWNDQNAGKEAFLTSISGGAKTQAINGVNNLAHRVAWGMHYGEWPSGQVLHKNGDNSDNRIENLMQNPPKETP